MDVAVAVGVVMALPRPTLPCSTSRDRQEVASRCQACVAAPAGKTGSQLGADRWACKATVAAWRLHLQCRAGRAAADGQPGSAATAASSWLQSWARQPWLPRRAAASSAQGWRR